MYRHGNPTPLSPCAYKVVSGWCRRFSSSASSSSEPLSPRSSVARSAPPSREKWKRRTTNSLNRRRDYLLCPETRAGRSRSSTRRPFRPDRPTRPFARRSGPGKAGLASKKARNTTRRGSPPPGPPAEATRSRSPHGWPSRTTLRPANHSPSRRSPSRRSISMTTADNHSPSPPWRNRPPKREQLRRGRRSGG